MHLNTSDPPTMFAFAMLYTATVIAVIVGLLLWRYAQ
jgi:heme/copper-type cytochrome/quinol oxidase subunit 4